MIILPNILINTFTEMRALSSNSTRLCRVSNWTARSSYSVRGVSSKTNEWFVFPRETEGNNYAVNWSLVADNISPAKEAFRNARVALITSRLPSKVANGKVDVSSVKFSGPFNLLEAGDSIKHDKFNESMKETLISVAKP